IYEGKKQTIAELISSFHIRESLDKIVINDVNSSIKEKIIFGTFPKKTTKTLTSKNNKQQLLQIPLENCSSLYAIEEKFNEKVETIVVAIVRYLLKRYSGNNKQGLTYLSSTITIQNISYEFTDDTCIHNLYEQVCQLLKEPKSHTKKETAEVLCSVKSNNNED